MIRPLAVLASVGLLASALAACAGGRPTSASLDPTTTSLPDASDVASVAQAQTQAQRELLRSGRMEVEVTEIAPARNHLESIVATVGGRVEHMQLDSDRRAEFELRVPAGQLDGVMDSIARLGKVESRTVRTIDVTEQIIDAEARLEALRGTRERLLQLLGRAEAVQEVVAVERELGRVQGEVESLERRLEALRGQVSMSELSVRLERRIVLGPLGHLLRGAGIVIGKLFVWR